PLPALVPYPTLFRSAPRRLGRPRHAGLPPGPDAEAVAHRQHPRRAVSARGGRADEVEARLLVPEPGRDARRLPPEADGEGRRDRVRDRADERRDDRAPPLARQLLDALGRLDPLERAAGEGRGPTPVAQAPARRGLDLPPDRR